VLHRAGRALRIDAVKVLVLVSSGLVAALVTFAANWLALIPWRRARNEHWTERARLYYPARVAAANNLWILPAVLTMLCLLPWILFKPMLHTFGTAGFFLLLLNTLLVGAVYRRLSHRLEIRADSVAHANEPDPGVYARALLRIHEDNLLPAVMAKGRATHPQLYDRLLAAGVTPDFPRPLPADSMAWHGRLLAASLGVLAMLLIKRLAIN